MKPGQWRKPADKTPPVMTEVSMWMNGRHIVGFYNGFAWFTSLGRLPHAPMQWFEPGEPEPFVDRGPLTVPAELTDDATWVAFDLARNVDKGPRLAQRDADIAMDLQVQYQGCIGELPR
jgi:hypothetical protein